MENKILLEDYTQAAKIVTQLKIKNKTFLITGSSGTLAKFLINSLLTANKLNNLNNKIIALSRDKKKIRMIFKNKNIIYKNYNEKIDNKVDYIVHFACPTNSRFFAEHPIKTLNDIYYLTDKFLQLAKKKNARFIYISSMEVYGLVKDNKPKKEDELGYIPLESARSSYPLGKRLSESLCHFYFLENKTDVVIIRLAQTFGAGSNSNDSRLFGYAIRCLKNNKDIVLSTDGKSYGNYVYLSDAISAILFATIRGKSNETYNVCGKNSNVTILEFCSLIATNKIKILRNNRDHIFPINTKLKMSTLKINKLGWKSVYNLEESINRYKKFNNIK